MRCVYSQTNKERFPRLGISNKKGQVWVETVIYTLIGIAVIGLVLGVSKPKIDQKKDEIVIEQSIESLGVIDDKIYEVQRAVGNRRSVDLKIGKGKLIIDMDQDRIYWDIESSFEYSEENVAVPLGRINVLTTQASPWQVSLNVSYDVEIAYGSGAGVLNDGVKEIDAAAVPYKITIENDGIWNNPSTGENNTRIIIRES